MTTVGELFDLYLELHAKPFTKSWANTEAYWLRHVKQRWSSVDAESLVRLDVQRWIVELAKSSGKPTANRSFTVLASVLNWSERNGYISRNPCRGAKTFRPEYRERFLQPNELKQFLDAVSKKKSSMRDVFLMLLFTGARKSNVLSMRWKDVNLEQEIWTIPASEMKNSHSLSIPLTPSALAILQERRGYVDSDWVFPGCGVSGHLRWPKNAWRTLIKEASLPDLRIHDLRRTLGSYLAISGASPYIIGAALGHKDPRSTAIYARLNVKPVREALEQIQEGWQSIFAKDDLFSEQTLSEVSLPVSSLSGVDQIRAEARVLVLMRSGVETRTGFHRRIGMKLTSADLDTILDSLVCRGLVDRALVAPRGRAHWRYRIAQPALRP